MAYIEDGEFDLSVYPINNQPDDDRFSINNSEFMLVKFHADITLLTPSTDQDNDDDIGDMEENAAHERYVYDKNLSMALAQFRNDENGCRAALVNALTQMSALPRKYYKEILDQVWVVFENEEEGLDRCGDVAVDIEILEWAENDGNVGGLAEDENDDETEEEEADAGEKRRKRLRIEPSFPKMLVDENMISGKEECVICLSGFEVGVEVYKLHCQHAFHCKCLLDWLEESATCPLCRKEPPNLHVLPAHPSKPT